LLSRSGLIRVAFDEIADANDKLGLQQVELLDRLAEDAGTMAAGAITDDGEAEVVGIIVEAQVGPRIAVLDLDLQSPAGGGVTCEPTAANHQGARGQGQHGKPFHRGISSGKARGRLTMLSPIGGTKSM